jgi:hypothetical protein
MDNLTFKRIFGIDKPKEEFIWFMSLLNQSQDDPCEINLEEEE